MAKKQKPDYDKLDAALDRVSYDWMLNNAPEIAQALVALIESGATPEQARRRTMQRTQRMELSLRVEQAARYLARELT